MPSNTHEPEPRDDRTVKHVQVGDEDWQPTPKEVEKVVEAFQSVPLEIASYSLADSVQDLLDKFEWTGSLRSSIQLAFLEELKNLQFELNDHVTQTHLAHRMKDRLELSQWAGRLTITCNSENNPPDLVSAGGIAVHVYDIASDLTYHLKFMPHSGLVMNHDHE